MCLIIAFLLIFQYLRDYQTFAGTARYWTETFAKASSRGVEEKVCIVLAYVSMIRAVFSFKVFHCDSWKAIFCLTVFGSL